MKYIRTKDGRINKPYKYDNNRHAYFCFPKNDEWTFYFDKDILQQADTVEELTDVFIVDLKGHCVDAPYDLLRNYEDFIREVKNDS